MKKSSASSRAVTLRQERVLTAKEFLDLAGVPPEVEWFANITNRQTRCAYQNDLKDFMHFTGIQSPEEFRVVTRVSATAWQCIKTGKMKMWHFSGIKFAAALA
jgi:hypothetical protein